MNKLIKVLDGLNLKSDVYNGLIDVFTKIKPHMSRYYYSKLTKFFAENINIDNFFDMVISLFQIVDIEAYEMYTKNDKQAVTEIFDLKIPALKLSPEDMIDIGSVIIFILSNDAIGNNKDNTNTNELMQTLLRYKGKNVVEIELCLNNFSSPSATLNEVIGYSENDIGNKKNFALIQWFIVNQRFDKLIKLTQNMIDLEEHDIQTNILPPSCTPIAIFKKDESVLSIDKFTSILQTMVNSSREVRDSMKEKYPVIEITPSYTYFPFMFLSNNIDTEEFKTFIEVNKELIIPYFVRCMIKMDMLPSIVDTKDIEFIVKVTVNNFTEKDIEDSDKLVKTFTSGLHDFSQEFGKWLMFKQHSFQPIPKEFDFDKELNDILQSIGYEEEIEDNTDKNKPFVLNDDKIPKYFN